jgi:hypothetical protein
VKGPAVCRPFCFAPVCFAVLFLVRFLDASIVAASRQDASALAPSMPAMRIRGLTGTDLTGDMGNCHAANASVDQYVGRPVRQWICVNEDLWGGG